MTFHPIKINKIISVMLAVLSFQVYATVDSIVSKPDNISEAKWSALEEVIIEAKLLPTPEGIGGASSRYGESVAIDGNRALVGSPRTLEHGVVYVLDYDGTSWLETQVIVPAGLDARNSFGSAVDLKGDRALIGDLFDQENGNQSGAAYIYELASGTWSQTQKLIASDGGSNDNFGVSVSLSTDRALIGAIEYDDLINGTNSGAAYVFDYDGSIWSESALLTASTGSSNNNLGNAVSLDGDKALVGSVEFDDNNNGINTGAAYLFELNAGAWSQTHQFLASDGADNDNYGVAVSLWGGSVLIGASESDENFNASGSAYIYTLNGSQWMETKLLAPDAAEADRFGGTVVVENERLLIGAVNGGDLGSSTGSAYIYDYNAGLDLWQFTQEIFADDITSNNFFASSLGLSGDQVIVGNFNDGDNGSQSGAAYVFDLSSGANGDWQQSQKLTTQGAVDDYFGYAVSLDGDRALIGAPYDDDNGIDSGSAYVFEYVNGGWSQPVKLISSALSQNFGMALSLSGNRAVISANNIEVADKGVVTIFEFNGLTWIETAVLESDSDQSDEFGFSVSLYGNRVLVGAPFANENGVRTGTTHVYDLISGSWQLTDGIIASDGQSDDLFGSSVSLLEDRALIGAYTKDDDFNDLSRAGAAYVFDYDAEIDVWLETKLQTDDLSQNDFFGSAVDLGHNRAVVGARNGFANGPQRGYAYVFDFDPTATTWDGVKISAVNGSSSDNFGNAVALDGDRVFVGAHFNANEGVRTGSAYQFDYDGIDWIETKKYVAEDGAERDYYGWSVSASNGGFIIGAYQDDDRGVDSGSVHVFLDDLIFADDFEE